MDVQASIHYDEATTAEVSKKRKRDAEDDHEGPEQKKVYIENGTLGIEALHRDVGSPYRLASTRKTPFFAKTLLDRAQFYGECFC